MITLRALRLSALALKLRGKPETPEHRVVVAPPGAQKEAPTPHPTVEALVPTGRS